jgi:hypothetical protein
VDWAISPGLNPKRRPASAWSQGLVRNGLAARKVAQAEAATAIVTSRLYVTTGPHAAVAGDRSAAGTRIEVFQSRLVPPG